MALLNNPDLEFLRVQLNKIVGINHAMARHLLKRSKQTGVFSSLSDTIISVHSGVIISLLSYFMHVIKNEDEPIEFKHPSGSYSFTPVQLEQMAKINEELADILNAAKR
ncbi:hypothetical protein LV84_00478 [Algoriphagus ratkowskyi]|uniref:Uncharacterized protein n=1 Tax=Algoriphagus ratkowskyi TaxID=57028 RepID=A0A2W7RGZ3_9BACT|nr:hypothetical protein [Algoriphagus ratkowskyi]PZX60208.1 hypothetical protein LV84_00478 [Algoriphagus ratkowskyi]TXD78033.1 hypothetical protein ESW18_08260 [Algoriphagus ratkowskyi]